MLWLELEPVGLSDLPAKLLQRSVWDFDHPVARPAHEVVMGVLGQVVDGRPVSEVDVVDDTEALELIEEPVDGRLVDVGMAGLDGGGDLLGGGVIGVIEEGLEDRSPWARDPSPVGSKMGDDLVHPLRCVHGAPRYRALDAW